MPLYEFTCPACKHNFEQITKINEVDKVTCPVCGGNVIKLLSKIGGIEFIGRDFYETEYKKKYNRAK